MSRSLAQAWSQSWAPWDSVEMNWKRSSEPVKSSIVDLLILFHWLGTSRTGSWFCEALCMQWTEFWVDPYPPLSFGHILVSCRSLGAGTRVTQPNEEKPNIAKQSRYRTSPIYYLTGTKYVGVFQTNTWHEIYILPISYHRIARRVVIKSLTNGLLRRIWYIAVPEDSCTVGWLTSTASADDSPTVRPLFTWQLE